MADAIDFGCKPFPQGDMPGAMTATPQFHPHKKMRFGCEARLNLGRIRREMQVKSLG